MECHRQIKMIVAKWNRHQRVTMADGSTLFLMPMVFIRLIETSRMIVQNGTGFNYMAFLDGKQLPAIDGFDWCET